ncbi:hypothetical protein N7540_013142 [Penicillium herquei]|nr:hypothetical protein N7540_013142 [Penicillium herquei]
MHSRRKRAEQYRNNTKLVSPTAARSRCGNQNHHVCPAHAASKIGVGRPPGPDIAVTKIAHQPVPKALVHTEGDDERGAREFNKHRHPSGFSHRAI